MKSGLNTFLWLLLVAAFCSERLGAAERPHVPRSSRRTAPSAATSSTTNAAAAGPWDRVKTQGAAEVTNQVAAAKTPKAEKKDEKKEEKKEEIKFDPSLDTKTEIVIEKKVETVTEMVVPTATGKKTEVVTEVRTETKTQTKTEPRKDGKPKLIRGPYLQMGGPTNMVLRWRTDSPVVSKVRYGLKPDKLDMEAHSPGTHTEHVVLLNRLRPMTKYYYALGAADAALTKTNKEDYFVTSPPSGESKTTRIWVLGDAGTRNANQTAVRDAFYEASKNVWTDLMLLLGDNAYPVGTDKEYQGAIFDMYEKALRHTVVWSCLGNHDAMHANGLLQSGVYFDIFTFPTQGQCGGVPSGTEAYYSFDYGNIHLISLDSQDSDRSPHGPMATWLKADLAANTNMWTIVYFHHPPYTKGTHDSDDEKDSGARMGEMRRNILPILEAGGVDLVLNGHSHNYERSFLLNGHYGHSHTFDVGMKVQDGDGREDGKGAYRKPVGVSAFKGTIYNVTGSAGQTNSPAKKNPLNIPRSNKDDPKSQPGKSGEPGPDWTPDPSEEIDEEKDRAVLDKGKKEEGKIVVRNEVGTFNHPAHFISLNVLGSVVIDVDGNRLDSIFLDNAGRRRDHYTLIKEK
jgi:Calcineurin-like phosphoesterase/Purple acid Phosphatase, N-terminal domain